MDTNEIPDPQTYALFRLFPYPPHAQDMGWLSKLWSLFRYPKYLVLYHNKDPKRDQNFDNHPHDIQALCVQALQALQARLGPGSAVQARFVELGVGVLFSWCLGI